METLNGFTVIASAADSQNHEYQVIVGARNRREGGFEYVVSRRRVGANWWLQGHYVNSLSSASRLFEEMCR